MKLSGDKLSCVRGGRTLFADLSFGVAAGQALLVMGPNGAGKTTLLRTIAGLLHPAAGRVFMEGGDPDETLSEQCHYVGHPNAIKSSLTVAENAAFWCRFLGNGGADRGCARDIRLGCFERHSRGLPVRRPEAAAGSCAAAACRSSALAAGRADRLARSGGARRRLTDAVERASAARRHGGGGDARAAGLRQRARAASRPDGRRPHERILGAVCRDLASPGGRAAPSASRWASTWWLWRCCRWASGRTSICCPASRRACCGWRCCWRRCCRSAACSRRTGGRLARGAGDRSAAARSGRRRQEPRALAHDRRALDGSGAGAWACC